MHAIISSPCFPPHHLPLSSLYVVYCEDSRHHSSEKQHTVWNNLPKPFYLSLPLPSQPKHNSANWTDIDAVFEKVPAESEPDVSVKSLSSSYEEPPKPTTVTGAEDGALFGEYGTLLNSIVELY